MVLCNRALQLLIGFQGLALPLPVLLIHSGSVFLQFCDRRVHRIELLLIAFQNGGKIRLLGLARKQTLRQLRLADVHLLHHRVVALLSRLDGCLAVQQFDNLILALFNALGAARDLLLNVPQLLCRRLLFRRRRCKLCVEFLLFRFVCTARLDALLLFPIDRVQTAL